MPQRLKAEEVRRRMKSDGVLLVCAYDDADKCRQLGVTESIPYPEFKSRLESVPKSQEIVFFCAWPQDKTAAGRAAEFEQKGYQKARILDGGVSAWKASR